MLNSLGEREAEFVGLDSVSVQAIFVRSKELGVEIELIATIYLVIIVTCFT